MWVYGDRSEAVDPRAYAEALAGRWRAIAGQPPGLQRHVALIAALIDAGKLAQGLADAAFARDGCDDDQAFDIQLFVGKLAGAAGASWLSDLGGELPPPATPNLADHEAVTLREPEGYAFYAVYPELYLEAATPLLDPRRAPAVVGVRSIGTSLAEIAAYGAGGMPPAMLRPVGDPFARRLAIGENLELRLLGDIDDGVLVVDEGPGASGSSFGAVGDWLAEKGVPAERVTYMPSHTGDLGPEASDRHRERWWAASKLHARFEDVILPRLAGWAEPLVGRAIAPMDDLSGGRWRAHVPPPLREAPAWPEQERRKYLLRTEAGTFLLKFAGLAGSGEDKLARGRALYAGGFTPEPLGLVHGFLVERWIEAPALDAAPSLDALAAYLGRRAALDPSPRGADDDALRRMAMRNLSLAGLPAAGEIARTLPFGAAGAAIAIDGRMHAWEWRRRPDGGLLKLDALDHCQAHDLISGQDLAWDLAGAAVEFDLTADDAERLRALTVAEGRADVDPRRVDALTLAYLAFQIGWWTLAAGGCEGERAADRARLYARRAAAWRPRA